MHQLGMRHIFVHLLCTLGAHQLGHEPKGSRDWVCTDWSPYPISHKALDFSLHEAKLHSHQVPGEDVFIERHWLITSWLK